MHDDQVDALLDQVSKDAERTHRLIDLAKALANSEARIILDAEIPGSTVGAAEDLYWLLTEVTRLRREVAERA